MSNLYTYNGSTWDEIVGATGASGTNGVDGKTLLNGSGAPSSGLGNNGDFYLDTTAHNLYGPKAAGAWGSSTSIIGPTGTAGSNGTPGAVWYNGAGAPSTTHNNGDYYLNTTNGDVYEQVSGSWGSPIENLTGPTGASGSGSGNVTGPASSVVSNVAMFNNTTGTLLKDSGLTLSGSNTGDQTTITGNAGTATTLATARTIGTLTGDVTSAGSTFNGSANNTNATVVGKINGVALSGLATGILKNTTTTGVPSIAIAADFPTLNQSTTGSAATLTTARTVQTNLASTTSASFDGSINITPGVTGTLPVANGGTGAITLTGLVKGNGTAAMTAATAGTDYQAPITLTTTGTSGAATLISNTLNIPQYSGGITFSAITASQTAAVNTGYIANSASLITLTLPSTAAVGSVVELAYLGTGGWKVAQAASVSIQFGSTVTTVGTGGSIASSAAGDAIRLLCVTANTGWTVLSSVGNLTVV